VIADDIAAIVFILEVVLIGLLCGQR
jgi:hypothetical protein